MRGKESDSLLFHSLDGNHGNWEPSNKVPAHYGCHTGSHSKGDKNPMKDPEVAAKISKALMGKPKPWLRGDNHPMRRPEHRQRMRDNNPMKDPKVRAAQLKSVRTSEHRANQSESAKKAWVARRKKWPPFGIRPKEEEEFYKINMSSLF